MIVASKDKTRTRALLKTKTNLIAVIYSFEVKYPLAT
jgi:hypothetical protein